MERLASTALPDTLEEAVPAMTYTTDVLFTPFTVGPLTLANRIVMAPMTRSQSPGGVPGPNVAAYYGRRAEHGVGLIITEGTGIDHPAALGNPNVPNFHGPQALAGWKAVADVVHAAGGRIMPQLWHVGMARRPDAGAPPVGPSGLTVKGEPVGQPLEEQEIVALIDAYARGAADAQRLGFDGVELHAAHGYLIDQFFWSGTNKRTDRFGGGIVERTRFASEIVQACRRATGPDFPIVLRFSQWKIPVYDARLATTPQELTAFLEPLVAAGVDMFHCSTRRFWHPEFDGSPLNLAGWTKTITGKPVITVGSVGLDNDFISGLFSRESAGVDGLDRLVDMVGNGEVDLVAIGRALLVDPAWAEKLRDGRIDELVPFTPDALGTLS
jgi:2,4-dienoyl-CoA reductase-like NADH-dependent reductase (Old Yellow Enzyme family)